MGWFRRVLSEVELGLSLVGASFAGIDIREILRSAGRGDPVAQDAPADDRPGTAGRPSNGAAEPPPPGAGAPRPARAEAPGPPAAAEQPPPGHPERLVPYQPLTDEERRLWSQLR